MLAFSGLALAEEEREKQWNVFVMLDNRGNGHAGGQARAVTRVRTLSLQPIAVCALPPPIL